MNIINPYRFGASGYEAEYQAVLDYATANAITKPDSAQNTINNNIIKNMKTEGIWDWDLFYYFSQPSGLDDFALINWANPGTYNCTTVNSPTFVANSGYKDNSGTSYLRTNFNPSTDSVSADGDDFCVVSKMFDVPSTYSTATEFYGGRVANNNEQFWVRNPADGSLNLRVFENTGLSISQSDMNSHLSYSRNSSGGRKYIYIPDASYDSDATRPSATFASIEWYLLAFNGNGSAVTNGNPGIEYFGWGNDTSDKEVELYEIISGTY